MSISHKSSIIKKTTQVGSYTLISRIFGIIREILQANYLGIGADAFITAFKIPNTFRKIFAEGALSAAFVPSFVQIVRAQGKDEASKLMSLAFVVFEGLVLIFCLWVMIFAEWFVSWIAPGFDASTMASAAILLRILMPFIFFISSSALLAGALQSVGHFFIPGISQALLNIFYIAGLATCLVWNLNPTILCYFILAGALAQCIAHIIVYFRFHFSFGAIDKEAVHNFRAIFSKFLVGAASMSIAEINFFIGTTIASYLPSGSISLIYYANRFMNIPLGIFATSFSVVLLPHLSQVSAYAPKRLGFYLLEATKLIFWVTVPMTLMMIFFSEKVFLTLFLSNKFTHESVALAAHIFIAYTLGLFFISINKILLNVYYALHATLIPAIVSVAAILVDVLLSLLFMNSLQATGLALAATLSAVVQMVLFVVFLHKQFAFPLYGRQFMHFVWRYLLQLCCMVLLYLGIYYALMLLIPWLLPAPFAHFVLHGLGFWFWVGPLSGALFFMLWFTRKLFGIRLYFLD